MPNWPDCVENSWHNYKKLSLIQVKLIVMPLTIGQWHIKEKTTYWFKNSKKKWGTKIKTKEVNLLLSKRTSMLNLGFVQTSCKELGQFKIWASYHEQLVFALFFRGCYKSSQIYCGASRGYCLPFREYWLSFQW